MRSMPFTGGNQNATMPSRGCVCCVHLSPPHTLGNAKSAFLLPAVKSLTFHCGFDVTYNIITIILFALPLDSRSLVKFQPQM